LFTYLPDADVSMISLRYFVCLLTHAFQLRRQTFGTALKNTELTHPLISGVHESKHTCCLRQHFEHML